MCVHDFHACVQGFHACVQDFHVCVQGFHVCMTMQVRVCVQDFHVTRANKRVVREQCYGPQDLRLGAFIHVYGRDFFLHDADDFTKHWYSVSRPAVCFCLTMFLGYTLD